MKRIGEVIKIRPECLEAYKEHHANPWPGINEMIKECNIQNYSIFQRGEYLFAYYEYVGEDFDADMDKMAQDPITQQWWKHTKPCFVKYAIDPGSEFYHGMEQIFYHG